MRIIVGYETSGKVREALRKLGHDAYSCDLLPSVDASPHHFVGDIWSILNQPWDFGVFHPTCTYLTSAAAWAFTDGPYHQRVKPGTLVGQARREARAKALQEVRALMDLPFPYIIENPIGVISNAIRKPDQIVQPYYFGHDASKATCIWRSGGVPSLQAHRFPVWGRMVEYPKGSGKLVRRWANQTDSGQNRLSPGADRWKERSETYQGIADAIALSIHKWSFAMKK